MTYPPKQFKLGNLFGVIGYARDDAVASTTPSGINLCKFSLIIGKDDTKEQGKQNTFANCEVWRDLSDYATNIKKGDTVFVIGTVKTSEYQGKTYTTLTADWLNIAKEIGYSAPPATEQSVNPISNGDFEEIDGNDNDLPF